MQKATNAEIRAWAKDNGFEVKATGIVPAKIRQAYEAAQTTPATVERTTNCKCGCGETPSGKSVYRPGHDARHVSKKISEYIGTIENGEGRMTDNDTLVQVLKTFVAELPSAPLRAKFVNAIWNAADREHARWATSDIDGANEYISPWFGNHPDDFDQVIKNAGLPR